MDRGGILVEKNSKSPQMEIQSDRKVEEKYSANEMRVRSKSRQRSRSFEREKDIAFEK